MSKALVAFESSIRDAEELCAHFDAQPKPPPPNAEVLKRAALVMALTAWETYVEDRVVEDVNKRLSAVNGSYVGKFVLSRLAEELKRFHNPTAEKTQKLFKDYLEVDVTASWEWQHFDAEKVRKTLNDLLAKRGDAVHRSKPAATGSLPQPHLVKRDELDKSVRFLKALVEATDRALIEP